MKKNMNYYYNKKNKKKVILLQDVILKKCLTKIFNLSKQ